VDRDRIVDELRGLIIAAAPDPALAAPVAGCGADEPLGDVIPFSSVIVLGVVVAVEDRFGIRVTKADLRRAVAPGLSLSSLAEMVRAIREAEPGVG
jgi:hypothetical protein